jgi:ZIP family zinc transporter
MVPGPALLGALLIAIANLLGGWFAGLLVGRLRLLAGFSAGFLISIALADLLPEAAESLAPALGLERVMFLTLVGFAGFLVLDKLNLFHFHEHEGHAGHVHRSAHVGLLAAAGMVLHSLADGALVTAAFQVSGRLGWMTAAALILHKLADGIGIVSLVGGRDQRGAWPYLWAASLAVLLGYGLLEWAHAPPMLVGYLLALFAGLFLYVGAGDLLPRAYSGKVEAPVIVANLLGFALAAAAHELRGLP